ncbi:Potassium-transporting ATPase alpha chain 2 [Plecturocebus cupreus]
MDKTTPKICLEQFSGTKNVEKKAKGRGKEKHRCLRNNCVELKNNHQKEEHRKELNHKFSNKELKDKYGATLYRSLQHESFRAPGLGLPLGLSKKHQRLSSFSASILHPSVAFLCWVAFSIWYSIDNLCVSSTSALFVGIFAYHQELKSTNIMAAFRRQVDNSPIHGMSKPLSCSGDLSDDNPLETKNTVFSSTTCLEGTATGTVANTGNVTITGQLASLTSEAGNEKTLIASEINTLLALRQEFTDIPFFIITVSTKCHALNSSIFLIGIMWPMYLRAS